MCSAQPVRLQGVLHLASRRAGGSRPCQPPLGGHGRSFTLTADGPRAASRSVRVQIRGQVCCDSVCYARGHSIGDLQRLLPPGPTEEVTIIESLDARGLAD